MASKSVRDRLAQDVGLWLTDGQIEASTHAVLRERYAAAGFGLAQAVKYVGIAGATMALFGLLGLIGALSDSQAVGAALLLGVGAALLWAGLWLSRDRLGRYGLSSKAVVTLGLCAVIAGLAVILDMLDLGDQHMVLVLGLLSLPGVGFLAYRLRSAYLLVLSVLSFFHWVGTWTSMVGRSAYEIDVQDPRLMAAAAVAVVGVGLWHERKLRPRTGSFHLVYQSLGLAYLNLSSLILSIMGSSDEALPWILAFAAAGVGQIVLGAFLHNALFTAFGVVAVGVNLYTRFFEHFWDSMHKGLFLLLAGGALLGVGLAFELWMTRRRSAWTRPA